jgi:hypothetical protein
VRLVGAIGRGNLANVLNQLNLPFNMVLSYLFLQTRFKRGHILGSILVLYGGMVNMIPVLTGQDTANMPDPSAGWIILYIVSLVPAAASNVYKEIGLKDVDLDIWYANIWISFYQLLIGCATIWTVRIKAFSDPPVPWGDFPSYVAKAHECFIGNEVELNGKVLPTRASWRSSSSSSCSTPCTTSSCSTSSRKAAACCSWCRPPWASLSRTCCT